MSIEAIVGFGDRPVPHERLGYSSVVATVAFQDRSFAVKRGQLLTWFTIAYNSIEAVLSIGAGLLAGSLSSAALTAETRQTEICWYLSAILLGGLTLNVVAGWWWADPIAALIMVPLIAWEGAEALRGRTVCADCAAPLPD